MSETLKHKQDNTQVEALLRRELARGDQALAGVPPVLVHMLSSNAPTLVTDDVLARIRGMLLDLARQLVQAEAAAMRGMDETDDLQGRVDDLATHLAASSVVLSYAYATTVEGQIIADIQQRSGTDQVLPPLVQELIASDDDSIAELAMTAMAAQARFVQAHRRMNLSLAELPAELFHEVVRSWSHFAKDVSPASKTQVEALLRADYDESGTRAGILGRLISKLNAGSGAALSVEHAGFALFATAFASHTKQPREMAILSCHPSQMARLALGLRSVGLGYEEIAQAFLILQPDFTPPAELKDIEPNQAATVLATAGTLVKE